ncbi:MAG: hypothetical protein ACR2FE_01165 [Aeromicrobium sp.]
MTDLPHIGGPADGALATIGCRSLDDVAARSEQEIADLHGMGPKGIRILRAALAEAGLEFAPHAV